MKKIILVLFISILITTGCTKKNLDGDKFTSIMEKKGYIIHNVIDQYGKDKVDVALIASNKKSGYQIEFLVFKSVDTCKNSFIVNRSAIKENKRNKDEETSVSNEKFSKYTLTSDDTYYAVSRINATLIYLDVDGSYKNEVNNLLKELGY